MMLEARGVGAASGGQVLLKGVSFTLDAGEWLMVAGPNGAGKTTLLRAVSQAIPYTGKVMVMGDDAAALSPRAFARRVAVLSQTNAVHYPFTVRQLVELGRYAHGGALSGGDAQGKDKTDDAMRLCGVRDLADRSALTLSGGELRRAFLAQVFAQDAPILLLDEPTGHLDLAYIRQIFEIVGEWLQRPGRAVLCVMHDLQLAARYGTKALLLDKGQVSAYGSAAEALTRENLRRVYGMDVPAWLDFLREPWDAMDKGEASKYNPGKGKGGSVG